MKACRIIVFVFWCHLISSSAFGQIGGQDPPPNPAILKVVQGSYAGSAEANLLNGTPPVTGTAQPNTWNIVARDDFHPTLSHGYVRAVSKAQVGDSNNIVTEGISARLYSKVTINTEIHPNCLVGGNAESATSMDFTVDSSNGDTTAHIDLDLDLTGHLRAGNTVAANTTTTLLVKRGAMTIWSGEVVTFIDANGTLRVRKRVNGGVFQIGGHINADVDVQNGDVIEINTEAGGNSAGPSHLSVVAEAHFILAATNSE